MINNPDPSDSAACIFDCGDANDDTMMPVEMNVAVDGQFVSHAHLTTTERVAGIAHERCYSEWYERTYGTPFTMST